MFDIKPKDPTLFAFQQFAAQVRALQMLGIEMPKAGFPLPEGYWEAGLEWAMADLANKLSLDQIHEMDQIQQVEHQALADAIERGAV